MLQHFIHLHDHWKDKAIAYVLIGTLGVLLACNLTKAVLPPTPTENNKIINSTPELNETIEAIQPTDTPKIPDILERRYYEEGEHIPCVIEATFFHLEGKQDAYQHFNDVVDQLLNQQIMDFKQEAQQAFQNEPVPNSEIKCTLTITYEIAFLSDRLISVLYNIDTYLGGAHPLELAHTLNYDFANQAVLDLSDLFEPQAPYLKRLADYCINELTRREAYEFPEGAQPTQENYRHWLIKPQGIEIIFDPYQVAPYALGRQRVLIPFSILQDVIHRSDVLEMVKP